MNDRGDNRPPHPQGPPPEQPRTPEPRTPGQGNSGQGNSGQGNPPSSPAPGSNPVPGTPPRGGQWQPTRPGNRPPPPPHLRLRPDRPAPERPAPDRAAPAPSGSDRSAADRSAADRSASAPPRHERPAYDRPLHDRQPDQRPSSQPERPADKPPQPTNQAYSQMPPPPPHRRTPVTAGAVASEAGVSEPTDASDQPEDSPVASSSRINGTAIIALILSLLGITAIVGVVCANIARKNIRRTGEAGEPLAVAAQWVGYIWIAAMVLCLIGFVILIR